MLLELAGAGALDGPVPGVVRPHRELVDQHAARRSRTARRRACPTTPSRSAIRMASSCAAVASSAPRPGRGREHLGADAVPLHGLAPPATPRPARTASAPPARTSSRTMATRSSASSGAVLLEEGGQPRRGRRRRRRPCRRSRRAASSAPPASRRRRRTRSTACDRGHLGPGRLRLPRLGQRPAQDAACPARARARPAGARSGGPSASSARRCSVGTCSWSKVTTVAPSATPAERGEVAVVAEDDVGGDEGGRVVRVGREHPQRLAERDRRLVRSSGPAGRRRPWRRRAGRCADRGSSMTGPRLAGPLLAPAAPGPVVPESRHRDRPIAA